MKAKKIIMNAKQFRAMKTETQNPKKGNFVLDKHDLKLKKVYSIHGEIYFIGKSNEPTKRNEFIFKGK